MLADPDVERRVADVEGAGRIQVEHPEVPAHALLRLVAQRDVLAVAVLVLEVHETGRADEGADISRVEIDIGGELRRVADQAAIVVAVAVVAVDVREQVGVAILDPEGKTVRERGVDVHPSVADLKLDRRRRRRPAGRREAENK